MTKRRTVVTVTEAGFLVRREYQNTLGYWTVTSEGFYATFPAFQIAKTPASHTIHIHAK